MISTPAGGDPGLDVDALLGLRPSTTRTSDTALTALGEKITGHIDRHDGYIAFSGGKDSLVVVDLARRVDPDLPVVFFDSGLEFPETLDFIREVADSWDLDLHRIPADPPLLDVLADTGAWDHRAPDGPVPDLHRILITEPARRAHDLLGPGELWGVRADESAGRRRLYRVHGRDGVIERDDGTVAYGPIWNWSTAEVWSHTHRHRLPVNPLYARMRELGVPDRGRRVTHLLDGSHLERGRLTWLRRGWPMLFEQLADVLPLIRQMT